MFTCSTSRLLSVSGDRRKRDVKNIPKSKKGIVHNRLGDSNVLILNYKWKHKKKNRKEAIDMVRQDI